LKKKISDDSTDATLGLWREEVAHFVAVKDKKTSFTLLSKKLRISFSLKREFL
jgi:hypothetical protein